MIGGREGWGERNGKVDEVSQRKKIMGRLCRSKERDEGSRAVKKETSINPLNPPILPLNLAPFPKSLPPPPAVTYQSPNTVSSPFHPTAPVCLAACCLSIWLINTLWRDPALRGASNDPEIKYRDGGLRDSLSAMSLCPACVCVL